MIAFWVAAVALTLAVVVALAVPLMGRGRAELRREHDRSNIALYRDQLRELERDRELGMLSAEQFDEAHGELGQRLLIDVPVVAAPESNAEHEGLRTGAWRFVALACVPISAVLAYLVLGMPQALDARVESHMEAGSSDQAKNLEQLTQRLAARIEAKPQDAEAWVLLARSYQMLGRAPEAVKAFARAIELVPDSAQLHADYADMQVASANGVWSEEATRTIAKALALDPAHPKALWLAGTEAYTRKDFKTALAYWEKLLPLTEAGSDVERMIRGSIAEVHGLMGAAPVSAGANTVVAANSAPAVAATAKQEKSPAGGAALSGTVLLDPELAGKVQSAQTVFVFARAAQGPKMPLAIRRIRVQDLPYRFSLDDSAAMAPGMVISAFDQVVVGARISRTGDATPKPGDFEGYSTPVKPGTSGIEVRIRVEVP